LADAYFALTAELAKEKHRADSWVKAARELAQSMGFDADENKGSLADWKFITTELAAAQAHIVHTEIAGGGMTKLRIEGEFGRFTETRE
jgi:hypothetical protein